VSQTNKVIDVKARELPIESSIAKEDRKKLAEALGDALASTYVLYAKTHNFHWNVAGPLFYSVHKLTDEQYRNLADAVDEIAERIRAIGFPANGGLKSYLERSEIADTAKIPAAREMVEILAADHQSLAQQLREAVAEAEDVDDVFTADLLTARIGFHEEAAWMLMAIAAE
jgi:starvation-inducible DNA-binding protein